jgi:uncharacterized membrane protein YeaQ/YmgE (transglycosylase-associated protein family)
MRCGKTPRFLIGILGIYAYGLIGHIVMATIGSVVLLYLVRKLR